MAIVTLAFSTLGVANPYDPPPSGYTRPVAAQSGKIYGVPQVWSNAGSISSNAIWYYNTPLVGATTKSIVKLPPTVTSNAAGCVHADSSGNGLMLITGTGTNNFRIFLLVAWQLSGSALWTQATAPIGGATVEFVKTGSNYEVFQNSVKIGTTYTNSTYTPTLGGCLSRGGDLAEFSVEFTPSQTVDTLTSPLVMGGAFSGTSTGYSNGAATLSFSGVSVPVTISSGAFSGTLPNFVDNGLIPFLPATSQTITLTQSSNSATINRNISLATGWEVIRNAGNPDTFESLVVGDLTYLAQHFIDAGNPLTTNDTAYWDTSLGLAISQDGKPTAPDALTQDIFIWRASDSKTYIHNVIITEEGEVIVSAAPSNVTFKTGRLEAKESIATFRAKLPFQAQSVAADITALRVDFNSLLTKMTNAGWFVGGEEQFTMIKIALQCGLPQLVKRIKEQAPDQMPVQSASVAADVAALRTDLNSLLTKLKNANLMATS